MTNKRKKLARQVAAKTGVSYQGAINQLRKETPSSNITFEDLNSGNCYEFHTPDRVSVLCLTALGEIPTLEMFSPDEVVRIPIVKGVSVEDARQLVAGIRAGRFSRSHALFLWRFAGDLLDIAVAFMSENDHRSTCDPPWLTPVAVGDCLWLHGEWPMYMVVAVNPELGSWAGKVELDGNVGIFSIAEIATQWKRLPDAPRTSHCSCDGKSEACADCCHEGNGKPIDYWRQKSSEPKSGSVWRDVLRNRRLVEEARAKENATGIDLHTEVPISDLRIEPYSMGVTVGTESTHASPEEIEVANQWIGTGLISKEYFERMTSGSATSDQVLADVSDPDPKATHHVGPPEDLVDFIEAFPDAIMADEPKCLLFGAMADVQGHRAYCHTPFDQLAKAKPSVRKRYYDWRSALGGDSSIVHHQAPLPTVKGIPWEFPLFPESLLHGDGKGSDLEQGLKISFQPPYQGIPRVPVGLVFKGCQIHIRFENEDGSCWGQEHDYESKGDEFFRTQFTLRGSTYPLKEHRPSQTVFRAWQILRMQVHRATYPGGWEDSSGASPEEHQARNKWYKEGLFEKLGTPTRLVITLELRKSQTTEPEQSAP